MVNLKLKQRIVGALVLAVIVAIILPVIFHNKQNAPELKLDSDNHASIAVSLDEAEANKAKLAEQEQQIPVSASPESTSPKSASESALSEDEVEQLAPALPPASKSTDRYRAHGIDPAVSTRGMTADNATPSIQPKAWVIQLGTFASHANANVLVKKLRANHFDVYATKEQTKKGTSVMRVYVGPMIKIEKIKKIQQQLKADFKLNGVIKPYKVVEDLN